MLQSLSNFLRLKMDILNPSYFFKNCKIFFLEKSKFSTSNLEVSTCLYIDVAEDFHLSFLYEE